MATEADVRRIALSFPEAEEAANDFAFSVRNKGKAKGFAWVWKERVNPKKPRVPNHAVIAVRVANLAQRDSLLAADQRKFFTEPHYEGFPAVLVRLAEVTVADLKVSSPTGGDAWPPPSSRTHRSGNDRHMSQQQKLDRVSFALALIGLGILGLVYGDFAMQWQPVPEWVPARHVVAYVSAAMLLLLGVGLLSRRTETRASRVLFVYSLLWLALKLPPLATNPLVEANWLGAGELAVIVAACWMLVTSKPRQRSVAKYLFAVSLIPIGLSHFFYRPETLSFVPAWLPFRSFWANLGGAGHVAAGVAVLLGIYPRLAATLEAAMIGAFTLLVWLPGVISAPTSRLQWTAFLMSWVIGAAAWVVARSLTRGGEIIDQGAVKAPANAFPSSGTASRPTSRL